MDIDIVLLWVDGNDPNWRASFAEHYVSERGEDVRPIRYRDWGTLPYLLRSIEENVPWIRRVHLVTNGQYPACLVKDHPKLNWVKHEDILPSEALPLFNSRAIELSIHRIEGLSEHFIYLNDDFFFLNSSRPSYFFRKGLPCDFAVQTPTFVKDLEHIVMNNLIHMNHYFNKKDVLKKWFGKWFNPIYGKGFLNNLLLFKWKYFTAFVEHHMPQPFLKSSFEECWDTFPDKLRETTYSRFRNPMDINQWFVRYWQLCSGKFIPVSPHRGVNVSLEKIDLVEQTILKSTSKLFCLTEGDCPFEETQVRLINAFEKKFPQKSSFER